MNEKILEILKNNWEEKKSENPFPAEYEISPSELDEIWHQCFIVRVSDAKFIYDYFGEGLIEAYSYSMEGEAVVEDALYPESPELSHKLIEVLNTKEPTLYEGALINRENQDIKFRKLLLPLGEGERVTHVLGGMLWRLF